ncbi:ATP-dependent zinc metalloprotease YME1-like protein [Smittium mucronatum]|uniref:ATP-dependent zinc metalloprotease YME1-like protein n=1 Tax=Smittium mucronatum TaxID=133383 RepID=A0A1R0GP69_9FUNG|nr:ATP-dependent zinc metalloprotease YME1-like protein [Smittium mucronatum]
MLLSHLSSQPLLGLSKIHPPILIGIYSSLRKRSALKVYKSLSTFVTRDLASSTSNSSCLAGKKHNSSSLISSKSISYKSSLNLKRGFSSNSTLNSWGSYPGIYSGNSNKYSNNNIPKNKHDSKDYKPSTNSDDSPSYEDNVFYKKVIQEGNLSKIDNLVLNSIENSNKNINAETIDLYLQALLLTNESQQNAALRLAHLLRKYPLLASNLKSSQLISNNFDNQVFRSFYNQSPSNDGPISHNISGKQDFGSNLSNNIKDSTDKDKNQSFNDENDVAGNGSNNSPIHVVVTEEKKSVAFKTLRWFMGTIIYAFCILTFLNLAMEGSGVMQTTHSPKAFVPEEKTKVTFGDVQGCDEAKSELQELVEFLKDPKEFSHLGGKLPRGVLLTGPPGTGKTLLARAVAGEANVPFFFMSGAEFDEIYVGVGSKRLRELFAAAREKAPSIVFIDEIDAIGSKRSQRDQSYMKQTLNQLLVELDGFSQSEGVIFIGATNFPESLDSALTRPGRFDRVIDVPLPDVRGRISILKLHTKNIPLSSDVDLSVTARGTVGFSGAELNNLVNIAAIQASKEKASAISNKNLEYAKDKILMGAERKSAYITPESQKSTAYHEGGHALVALHTKGALPLHKATIMPRGHALGVTVQLPEMDKNSYTRQEYLAMLDVCMGGYVAEQLVFGYDNVTSGSSSDLSKATNVATSMVTQYGMSDMIGHVAYDRDTFDQLSAETKKEIDLEIRRLNEESYKRVLQLLTERRNELDLLAKALVDYETLDLDEIMLATKGQPIPRQV